MYIYINCNIVVIAVVEKEKKKIRETKAAYLWRKEGDYVRKSEGIRMKEKNNKK